MSNETSRRSVDPTATVNEIIVKYPAAVSVFNEFGIDACCGGDAGLDEAARRDGANIEKLIAALDTIIAAAARTP